MMFCSTGRAYLPRFLVDIIAGETHWFSTWNLSFRGYNSSAWSNLLELTSKYLKVLQIFEDTNSCDSMSTCIMMQ